MPYPEFTTEELNREIWKPVIDWEGIYSVSDLGRVRREKAESHTHVGRLVTPHLAKDHYQARLYDKPRKAEPYIASLVMAAFVGPRPEKHEVSHKDGDVMNNRLSNLCYKTKSAHRLYDADKFGRYRGEQNGATNLTDSIVLILRERFAQGNTTLAKLGAEYSIDYRTIHDVVTGKVWKHIGGPLHIPDHIRGHRPLTEDNVRDICRRLLAGETGRALAAEYHVQPSLISRIATGKRWQRIAKEFFERLDI